MIAAFSEGTSFDLSDWFWIKVLLGKKVSELRTLYWADLAALSCNYSF